MNGKKNPTNSVTGTHRSEVDHHATAARGREVGWRGNLKNVRAK
jgi:hypothetical protein